MYMWLIHTSTIAVHVHVHTQVKSHSSTALKYKQAISISLISNHEPSLHVAKTCYGQTTQYINYMHMIIMS